MLYSGWDGNGDFFYSMEILYGGIPGRPIGDGMDGHSWWPLFENIPTEYLEAYYPLRIDGYTTVTDSGGPGLHRGGNGVEKRYVYLEPGEVSIHDDRWLTRPWGVLGGLPGARVVREEAQEQRAGREEGPAGDERGVELRRVGVARDEHVVAQVAGDLVRTVRVRVPGARASQPLAQQRVPDLARAPVLVEAAPVHQLDRVEVEAVVVAELGVLGGDHRADQAGRYLVQRLPAPVEALALENPLDHQPGDRRRREAVDGGDHHRSDQAEDQHEQQHAAQQAAEEPFFRRPRQDPCPYPTARW